MAAKRLRPVHPGEILLEEFLNLLGITQYRLAKDVNVPPRRINEIVHGKRAITADTALRLGRWLGTSAEFWMNLQTLYDLRLAEQETGSEISRTIPKLGPVLRQARLSKGFPIQAPSRAFKNVNKKETNGDEL